VGGSKHFSVLTVPPRSSSTNVDELHKYWVTSEYNVFVHTAKGIELLAKISANAAASKGRRVYFDNSGVLI